MNWSRSWSKVCDSDRIVPSPSRSASGPWCWVGRSVMFLFDCWLAGWPFISNPGLKRLSATDISALASMKNVAKCDTWCELQNPVNHRVFERKLRPKPSGRGHVCLGVTHRRPPHPLEDMGRKLISRVLPHADVKSVLTCSGEFNSRHIVRRSGPKALDDPKSSTRPQVRRDHPLSLSISISGGKETNKDSLSNGERTGKSPA
ncbi:hypothetical protein YC2023_107996 [Brassica napus]